MICALCSDHLHVWSGQMRCIEAMGEWSQLHSLSETYWDKVSSNMK
jgi:hypothetical protein